MDVRAEDKRELEIMNNFMKKAKEVLHNACLRKIFLILKILALAFKAYRKSRQGH